MWDSSGQGQKTSHYYYTWIYTKDLEDILKVQLRVMYYYQNGDFCM